MGRRLNEIFATPYHLEKVGISFNLQLRTSAPLMTWTGNKIIRSAIGIDPREIGITPPCILTSIISTDSEFFPNKKDRNEVKCGLIIIYEEALSPVEQNDITLVSVVEEAKKTLFADVHLKLSDGVIKTDRLHRFELAAFDMEHENDKVTVIAGYQATYIVDLNAITRSKLVGG